MIIKTKKFFVKLSKIRNNKYYNTIKNIINTFRFLRYIALIFFITFSIYLVIPKTFDLSKKEQAISNLLLDNYNINLEKYSKISYLILPTPRVLLEDVRLNFKDENTSADIKYLFLPTKVSEIYKKKSFIIKKIILKNSVISIEIEKIKNFLYTINEIKETVLVQDSKITLKHKQKTLINLNDINFDNHNNNLKLKGLLYGKKTKFKFLKNKIDKKLSMNIPSMGTNVDIIFFTGSNLNSYKGILKSKVLGNNIKFKFQKDIFFEVLNSYFSNSQLNTSFDGIVKLSPFFDFNISLDIKNIKETPRLIDSFFKYFNQSFNKNPISNGRLKIEFNRNKYQNNFFKRVSIIAIFENGNFNIDESLFEFEEGNLRLTGITTNYGDFKRFNFKLSSKILNKDNFLKSLDLPLVNNKKPIDILVNGSLNLSSNKINFEKIVINKNYVVDEKDKVYYKKIFENSIIQNNLLDLTKISKIKTFLKEVIQ